MYAQTITAAYDSAKLQQAMVDQIGASAVPALEALQRTSFAAVPEVVAPTVVAAQLLRNAASIIYFFDGPDTILVHITAATVIELKAQAKRVTRQSDKWLSRLAIPAAEFALTAYCMSGTTAAESAGFGVLAAMIAFLIEIALFVYHAEEWQWKDVS